MLHSTFAWNTNYLDRAEGIGIGMPDAETSFEEAVEVKVRPQIASVRSDIRRTPLNVVVFSKHRLEDPSFCTNEQDCTHDYAKFGKCKNIMSAKDFFDF